jgi:antitoxin ParD1/3/4
MAAPLNLNVSLTRRFMDLVREHVESGRYQSASEVIREGLRLLEERDRGNDAYWAVVREKVAEGKAELRAGKGIPSEQFMRRMRAYTRDVKADLAKNRSRKSRGTKA